MINIFSKWQNSTMSTVMVLKCTKSGGQLQYAYYVYENKIKTGDSMLNNKGAIVSAEIETRYFVLETHI